MHYEKITTEILEKLKAIVGPKNVVTDADAMQPYSHDEVTDPAYHHMPEAVVFAETAQQVSAIIKLANACHFPVVPRGAGTGLACGAVPEYGGLVLSLEKMNKILEINENGLYAVVEPGVRTSDLQEAAEKKGLFYAGDPCSGDSCFIGGNIATNAGGNRAVKYGTTRHQVYSVEVVNTTGRIVNRLGRDPGHHHQGHAETPAQAEIRLGSAGHLRRPPPGHGRRHQDHQSRHHADVR